MSIALQREVTWVSGFGVIEYYYPVEKIISTLDYSSIQSRSISAKTTLFDNKENKFSNTRRYSPDSVISIAISAMVT